MEKVDLEQIWIYGKRHKVDGDNEGDAEIMVT